MAWFASRRRVRQATLAARGFQLSRIQRHTILREMARGELSRGAMSKRDHRRLVDYAARLGIESHEAAELIDEARRAIGMPATPLGWGSAPHEPAHHRSTPRWLVVAIVVLSVSVLNLLLKTF